MKNLKVSAKLLAGFSAVAALTIIVGIMGIISLKSMDSSYSEGIETHGYPLAIIGKALSDLQNTRVDMRDAILYTDNEDMLRKIEANALEDMRHFEEEIEKYGVTIKNDEALAVFESAMEIYKEIYKPALLETIKEAKGGISAEKIEEMLDATITATEDMVEKLNQTIDIKLEVLDMLNAANTRLSNIMLAVVLVSGMASAIAAITLGLYLSRLISKPLITLTEFMSNASATGDITLRAEDLVNIEKFIQVKDEIGRAIGACAAFVNRVTDISKKLGTTASGDLTTEVELLSDKDTMGTSLSYMIDNLNNMFGEIQASTDQVSTGAKQVADGAQSLAQGSTQQAAAIEELSGSIGEIAERTKQNAEKAEKTANLSDVIKDNAEKGSHQMDAMIIAVKEINEASQSISKIIKTIDDIAFQTNILALNAAVEAARAGQHGKGFAVVAEEVRNLASKSAEAAKDTGNMIQNAMDKAELGSRIAGETAASLTEIVSGVNESSRLIMEIAKASEEQSSGIAQINIGIDQVTQVVQQNSATAEESAAASEEMSGQSAILQELIAQFKLKAVSD